MKTENIRLDDLYAPVSFGGGSAGADQAAGRGNSTWYDWNGDGDSYDELGTIGAAVGIVGGAALATAATGGTAAIVGGAAAWGGSAAVGTYTALDHYFGN